MKKYILIFTLLFCMNNIQANEKKESSPTINIEIRDNKLFYTGIGYRDFFNNHCIDYNVNIGRIYKVEDFKIFLPLVLI